ncbi:hypothetical protein Tco_0448048 [Tanacetum coccineum]
MKAVPPPFSSNYIPLSDPTDLDESQMTYGPKQTHTSDSEPKTSDLDSCESNSSVESLESMPKHVIIKPKTSKYAPCKSNLSAKSPEFFPKSVCARNESVRKADNPRKNNKSPRVHTVPTGSNKYPPSSTQSPAVERFSPFWPFGKIMAASAIAISSNSSDESVGSPPSRVILFSDIPTVILSTSVVATETSTVAPVISSAALVVETILVASPTELCGLVSYFYFDSDLPDEIDSPEYITPLPATSPFLYTDSFEASNSSDRPPSQDPYVATVAHWRSRVTTRSPSPSDFPIAPVTALHGTHHRPSSSSSPLDSSPVHSSGLDAPDHAHYGYSTRDVSPRLGYPLRRAPRLSEAFYRWCAAPFSTLYPPTTSESSSGDSSKRPLHSSSHYVGPSRKRCRSPVDSVPSSTPVMGSLAPTRADLLPPRKRFRDSYSSEASIEEDTEVDPIETEVDMELGIGDRNDVRDHVEINHRDVRDDTEEFKADTSA